MRDNAIGINVEGFHFSYLPFVFLGYQVNLFFGGGSISIYMGRRARAISPEEVEPLLSHVVVTVKIDHSANKDYFRNVADRRAD